MKTKSKLLIAGLFVMLFGLNACRNKDEEPKPYVPKPADAGFTIYQGDVKRPTEAYWFKTFDVENYFEYFACDTVYHMARFKANDTSMMRYEWKIGKDDRIFTGREFSLMFPDVTPDDGFKSYTVQLIATSKDSALLPPHLQKDTAYRTLTMFNEENYRWIGRYEGETTQFPGQKRAWEVRYEKERLPPYDRDVFAVYDLPDGVGYDSLGYSQAFDIYYPAKLDNVFTGVTFGYRTLGLFGASGRNPRPYVTAAFLRYDEQTGEIIIDYDTGHMVLVSGEYEVIYEHHTFRGIKVY